MNPKILIGGGVAVAVLAAIVALSKRSSGSSQGAAANGEDFYPELAKWRRDFLACVFEKKAAGTLYQWGGGHGHGNDYGLDCSGLVNVCAQSAGMTFGANADWMYKDLRHVQVPTPGDVALYGSSARATHVRVVTGWFPEEGRASTIGAEGGGPNVTTPEEAIAQDARVRAVGNHLHFGSPFLGFRSLEEYGKAAGMNAAAVLPSAPS